MKPTNEQLLKHFKGKNSIFCPYSKCEFQLSKNPEFSDRGKYIVDENNKVVWTVPDNFSESSKQSIETAYLPPILDEFRNKFIESGLTLKKFAKENQLLPIVVWRILTANEKPQNRYLEKIKNILTR